MRQLNLFISTFFLLTGRKGNLTERVIAVVVSLLLTIPSVFGAIYILIWQTYVLRAEVILVAIQLAFLALELIFAIVSIITFARLVCVCVCVCLCVCVSVLFIY